MRGRVALQRPGVRLAARPTWSTTVELFGLEGRAADETVSREPVWVGSVASEKGLRRGPSPCSWRFRYGAAQTTMGAKSTGPGELLAMPTTQPDWDPRLTLSKNPTPTSVLVEKIL